MKEHQVIGALKEAYDREIEASALYRVLGEQQTEERRRQIFYRLAQAEADHASQFASRIAELGGTAPNDSTAPSASQRLLAKSLGTDAMLRRIEAEEERNITHFERNARTLAEDEGSHQLFLKIEAEERQHATLLHSLKAHNEPRTRLDAMLKGEKWHANTGSWIGDAIYGVNDGLGAVFGVVSGMSGASSSGQIVLVSGLVAMLASALSMGSSAFMASKSEREVYDAELGREKLEIDTSPEHEKEELGLLYELKGFSPEEAAMMAERIAQQPELFLKTMAQEELGLGDRQLSNPWVGAASAAFSTAVGGIVPIIPFFFLHGMAAVLAAAVVGMAAHFAVGAAKSLITARSWWASGFEMTLIGFITGGVTFALGKLFHVG